MEEQEWEAGTSVHAPGPALPPRSWARPAGGPLVGLRARGDGILGLPGRPWPSLALGAPCPSPTPCANRRDSGTGHHALALASLPGLLLWLLPLLRPLPPDPQRGPAAPIPGPAGGQLSPGPVGCCPAAPAKEGAGKRSVPPEDGHCHQGPDQLFPPSPAGRGLG